MAYTFSVSNVITNASQFLFILKSTLVSAGWVVKSSSDGLTYNATGDQITSSGTGAGGIRNNSAWFRIQCPTTDSVNREFTFQVQPTAFLNWRVKYSYNAGFTGGSPAILTTPFATDEKFILGSGTDTSPIFGNACSDTATLSQYAIGDASEGYSFYTIQTTAGGTLNSIFFMDHLDNFFNDLDPVVMFISTNPSALLYNSILSPTNISLPTPISWFCKGKIYEDFKITCLLIPYKDASTSCAKRLGPNPYTGNDNIIQLFWGRQTSSTPTAGYKGRSHIMRLNLNSRAQGSTYNSKTLIQLGDFVFPWDASTTPVL